MRVDKELFGREGGRGIAFDKLQAALFSLLACIWHVSLLIDILMHVFFLCFSSPAIFGVCVA